MAKTKKQQFTIDGRDISVSNLDKIFFPEGQVRKADVIDFYAQMAEVVLPHLKDRPVTLKRYPNGALGEFFYEKDAPGFTPEWVETFSVPRRELGGNIRYILVNDRATLVWLANLANLEIHPFLHRAPHIDRPTSIVFDLDPGEGADVLTCARVAFLIRDMFQKLELESFVKVSGSKGLQVYLPLNTKVTYETTQPFAKAVAELLAKEHPALVVSDMAKKLRGQKVLIDWSQNADFKTTIGVYSLRAKSATPFVSLPVTWAELETAAKKKKPENLYFEMNAALKRVQKIGDLFADVLSLKQQLPTAVIKHLAVKAAPKSLEVYAKKRDFSKTREPAPTAVRPSKQGSRRRFVIQKHAASHLHYDFRLEMHDVLKSWAVPKGPPFIKGEKRLAMPTEDHPLDYFDFEGVIPKGQYGGGTVMVWDIGTYELLEGNYYQGRLRFHLSGVKLKGEWELVRWPKKEKRDTWLLIKAGTTMRTVSKKRDDSSAVSDRSMEEIAEAADATWKSNREYSGG
jgi:bifunctional non-homologous end joining protein LigD